MVSAAVLAWGACPAGAINIVLNFEDTKSASPSFDPFTGTNAPSGLQDMFQHAESFYQDVFEDSHTLTINYWYTNLTGNQLGLHSVVSQSGGRETVADIRIDTTTSGGATRNWFIDPTPGDNSEFNMQQTLWRDLSGANQADWFNQSGTAIDTFETGFTGTAIAGLGATGASDMLSVVMHEVGHALGMSAGNNSTVTETNDGDYDFDSVNIFGRTLAVETANNSGDDNLNIAHLEDADAMMNPSVASGQRQLPSHTDLLAMAAVHNYTALDIPRREFYGGSSWNTSGNWVGNTVPGSADDVFVRDAQGSGVTLTAGLSANGSARDIQVSEGANIDTNGFKLDASGDVTVTGLNTDIFVNPGGELEADEVFIQDQSEIEMSGGTLDVRRVTVDAGTQIQSTAAGSATVQVSNRLINNGQLVASGDSLLFFSTTTPTPWDVDGSGSGTINASNGRIWFDTGAMTDSFSSEVTVGAGQFFRFDAPWTLDGGGTIDLNGGATFADRARIIGGVLTATGSAQVQVSGQAGFDNAVDFGSSVLIETGAGASNVEFNATADLNGTDMTIRTGGNVEFNATTNLTGTSSVNTISNINSNATPRIQFDGQTNYASYTLNKTGSTDLIVQQTGNAQFVGTNTINADTFDMDGNLGNNTLTFGDGINSGSLILNVDAVDTFGNTFNGTLDLDNGGFSSELTVNLTNPTTRWTMAGTANLSGNAFFFVDRISGTRFNIDGMVNVSNSRVSIDADVDLLDNAQINFNSASSNLGFKGFTQVTAGAEFVGAGTLTALSGSELFLLDGLNLPSASLTNSGTLSLLGTGAATVQDFTQTSGGQWNVNLAGSSSTLYDVLVSDGDIDLAGTLGLSVSGGYDATLYQTHTILNGVFGAALTGKFSTILGVVLDATTGLAVTYTSQDVRVQRALLGDADLDGFIAQADLDAVLLNWGNTTGMWATGDFDGDGFVAQADLDAVLLNWGATAEPSFAGSAVPEPGAAVLLLGSALGYTLRRRRRSA